MEREFLPAEQRIIIELAYTVFLQFFLRRASFEFDFIWWIQHLTSRDLLLFCVSFYRLKSGFACFFILLVISSFSLFSRGLRDVFTTFGWNLKFLRFVLGRELTLNCIFIQISGLARVVNRHLKWWSFSTLSSRIFLNPISQDYIKKSLVKEIFISTQTHTSGYKFRMIVVLNPNSNGQE